MSSAVATKSALEGGLVRSGTKALNESIVALALLEMVIAGVQPLKIFQIPTELLLLSALLYACTTIKYDRWQISLLLVLVFVTLGSYFTTDISTFLINAKINTLAVLSLLYFSKVRFRSKLIFPAFVLTSTSIIINFLVPEIFAPLVALSSFEEFNLSRFGGLFLNAHYNAYFMAVVLIYYGYKKRLYGLGVPLLYITFSKVIFVSYVANLVAALGPVKRLIQYRLVALAIAALGGYWILQNISALMEVFDTEELGSTVPVLMQLFDPAYYQVLLNPFPSGNIDVTDDARALYGFHSGHNEVGYFHLATACGVFLTALYLHMLLRYTRYFRVFILLVLLHFGFQVLSPLIIYLLVTYSREIHMLRIAVSDKKRVRLRVRPTLSQHEGLAVKPN